MGESAGEGTGGYPATIVIAIPFETQRLPLLISYSYVPHSPHYIMNIPFRRMASSQTARDHFRSSLGPPNHSFAKILLKSVLVGS